MVAGQDYYVSYRFYDRRGRRLSAFARNTGAGDLEIHIFTYSKNERNKFSKVVARKLWHRWEENPDEYRMEFGSEPQYYIVEPKEGQHLKVCFMEHMEQNYYKRISVPTQTDYLISLGDERIGKRLSEPRVDYELIEAIVSSGDDMNIVNNN